MKIKVEDALYTDIDRLFIYNTYCNNNKSSSLRWIDKNDLPDCFKNLVKFASKEFDLSNVAGYELWTHYNTKPEWHYDKDEYLFHETGLMKFPICSIVYYPFVDSLIGGKFITEDIAITPKTNRGITFSSGVYHNVEPYNGQRFSLLLNAWNYKIKID